MKAFRHSFATAVILLWTLNIQASHLMGGSITYQWVTGNTYNVTLTLYRDCSGIPADSVETLNYSSTTCGMSGYFTAIAIPGTGMDVSPLCAQDTSTCFGGTYFGFQKWVYNGQVTLPQACTDWKFSFSLCCRNAAITNISATTFYIEASLNNLSTPFNNSPVFINELATIFSTNQTQQLSFSAYDVDGDSLVYKLRSAYNGAGVLALYDSGYSGGNPILSNPPSHLDSSTGIFTVTPIQTEVDVVALQINEYRQGILVGSVSCDVQELITNSTNLLPSLSGINGTSNFVTNVCSDSTLAFSILSLDSNLTDSTTITTTFLGQVNTFTTFTAGQNQTALFTWNPDSTYISPLPYLLTAVVRDNSCPYNGLRTYVYKIYVNQCLTDSVWPGDANADLAVNMYDILPVGLGYHSTGPVRPGASISWNAQAASDWAQQFSSGVNYKHADCNGDGLIDSLDLNALSLNYGMNHLRPDPANIYQSTLPDLSLEFTPDTLAASSPVTIDVNLGNSSFPVNDLYGITFTLNFSSDLIQPGSFVFNPSGSWLGNTTDMIYLVQGEPDSGFADIGLVRTNQAGVTGNGTLGTIQLFTNSLVTPGSYDFTLSNVKAITSTGADIAMNIISDSLQVVSATSITELDEAFGMNVYTDFSRHEIQVRYTLAKPGFTDLRIISVLGQEVKDLSKGMKNAGSHFATYDIADLPAGIYLIDLFQNNRRSFQKIIIVK